jgi:hypothetical protein
MFINALSCIIFLPFLAFLLFLVGKILGWFHKQEAIAATYLTIGTILLILSVLMYSMMMILIAATIGIVGYFLIKVE